MTEPLSREEIDDRRRLYAGVPEKWGDPVDVVQARWVATVDARDARIAELEAELLTERRTAKLSLDHIERFDAAVKRAEEAECLADRLMHEAKAHGLDFKAAEQREAAALRELAKAEADLETVADQHIAALASLEVLRAIWSDADTAHDLEEWELGDIIHAGRKTVDALATTTEGAGNVLADLKEEAGFVVKRANREALSTGACIECGSSPTCIGDYGDGLHLTCDECCGHCCEDGWCVPLALAERDEKTKEAIWEVQAEALDRLFAEGGPDDPAYLGGIRVLVAAFGETGLEAGKAMLAERDERVRAEERDGILADGGDDD